ncbi:hypothetical protein ACJX0J_023259, partial [Zea mays]
KARATPRPPHVRKAPTPSPGKYGGATRRPQSRSHRRVPPVPPPRGPRPVPAPAVQSGGGVHGAEPQLAGGHRGAPRRRPSHRGPRGAHPQRRGRRRRRHHRLRRVPPPRQQEVHGHGLQGLLRLQPTTREARRSLLRSTVLLAGRHRRRAAQNGGDLGRRGAPPHLQRHRVRGGDVHRHDEGGKG